MDLVDDWSTLLPRERLKRIRAPLARVRNENNNIYLQEDIPDKKLANLRAATQMPPTEDALALIDGTVFGSAKHGVLFGETAMYIHNSWAVTSSQHRGRIVVPYDQLATMTFEKGWLEVRFPGGAIETSGTSFSVDQMIDLLGALQRSMQRGASTDDPVIHHDGIYISAHLVATPTVPTNEVWPGGIATHADASIVTPPLDRRWGLDVAGTVHHPPAIARDFVIVVVEGIRLELVGLELTTGRQFWRRTLPTVYWSKPVIANGMVFLKGGSFWHAFDLETGERKSSQELDVGSLGREVRDQLVIAGDAAVHDLSSYTADPAALTHESVSPGTALQFICANHRRRMFATPGPQHRAPTVRLVDHRGAYDVLGGHHHGQLVAHAMTDRYVFLSGGTRALYIVDAEAEPPVVIQQLETGQVIEHISIGSDHLVTAGERWVRCFRGS